MTDKPEALRLADDCDEGMVDFAEAADELRRLHAENEALRAGEAFHKVAVQQRDSAWMENEALHKANEAFGKRQEWWNERMFELEKQREELLEQLSKIVEMIDPGGHDVVRRVRRRHAAIARAEEKQ